MSVRVYFMEYKKVAKGMVFGVFDAFHKGHEYLLTEAKKRCTELVVVVTLPHIVEHMKQRQPHHTLTERMAHIKEFDTNLNVISGDEAMGEWRVLKTHRPDVVFLGYDQQGIASELDMLGIAYEFIDAHHPEKYKSSLAHTK